MLNSTIPNDEFRPGRFAVYRSAHFNTPWSWAEIGTVKPVTFLPPPTDGRTVRIDKRNVLRIEDTQAAAERCTAALNAAARASRAESEAAMNIYRAAVDRVRAEGVPEGVTIVEPDPMKAVVDIIGQCDADGLADIAAAVIARMGELGDPSHGALVGRLVSTTDDARLLPGVKQMLAASYDALQAFEPEATDGAVISYRGRVAAHDSSPDGFEVEVVHPNGMIEALPLRLDLRNHSPSGFAWGYMGSGPAQLALAILAHALGDDERACQLYQNFKVDVVARWPMDADWSDLTVESVRTWADAHAPVTA